MTSPEHTAELAQVNQRIVGEGQVLPAVTLKDGSTVQTGTVATMLANIGRYNAGERGEVERELALAVPTLLKIGLFELFTPDEWLAGGNPGRALVGRLAREQLKGAAQGGGTA